MEIFKKKNSVAEASSLGTLKLASSLPATGHYVYGSLRRRSTRKLFDDAPSVGSMSVLYPELPKNDDDTDTAAHTLATTKRKYPTLRKYASNHDLNDDNVIGGAPDLINELRREAEFTASLPSSLYSSQNNLAYHGNVNGNSAQDVSAVKDAKDLANLQRIEDSPQPALHRRDSKESIASQLLQSVDNATSCFARKPKAADDLELKDWKKYKGPVSLQYSLETFTEARSTCWAFEPFIGQPIDGPGNGSAPGPWDIPVTPAQKFIDANVGIEVPHTSSLKPCHECVGIGRVRCYRCQGKGRVTCHHCNGKGRETFFTDGRHQDRSCSWCDGNGKNRCAICYAHGQVPCRTCESKGQLKCFIRLSVTWTNHIADHIVERSTLPENLIKGTQGSIAFEEELPRVWPINHFPDQAINKASAELIRQHTGAYPSERILIQRQKVRVVPVADLNKYKKGSDGKYHMYGIENQTTNDESYPERRCWGCLFV
ncbi:protein SSUH2 homolog [Tubulanus polymorphus]|uniref:protein SSUH2 homolog n=1 Tax=Tubulanus polymorphus TaxID=672921 RepID=UPI003DA1D6BA